jgi:hypothetical protein
MSRLHKVHNVTLVFRELEQHGVTVDSTEGHCNMISSVLTSSTAADEFSKRQFARSNLYQQSSIPGDEEILLGTGPHSPTRTLSASGSTLADSLADRITNSIPVDEEIIPAASQQSPSDSSLTDCAAAERINNSILVDEEIINILT